MLSRFFIDRPIFAAVISLFLVLAGLAAMRSLPIAQYPEIAPPVVTVQAVYPGASAQTIEQTVASPIENAINGVPGMIYMSSSSGSNGVAADPGDVRHRHQRRHRVGQRQQPRQRSASAAARGSSPPGRVGGARQLGVPAGSGVLLARRPLRRSVHVELRHVERPRPAEAAAGHDERADLRRARLCNAHLAQARPDGAAAADACRHHRRRQRAERAVRRRQGRPVAVDARDRTSSTRSPRAAGSRIPRSSSRSSSARIPTAPPCGCPTSRASSSARRTTSSSAASTASRRRSSASSCRPVRTRSTSPRRSRPRSRSWRRVSRKVSPIRCRTTRRASSRCRSVKS